MSFSYWTSVTKSSFSELICEQGQPTESFCLFRHENTENGRIQSGTREAPFRWRSRPIPPQGREELARSPCFSILGKSFTLKQTSTHTRQGSCVCVCLCVSVRVASLQFQEDPDGDTVQHEVWGNWFLTHLEHRTASRKYSWEKGKRWDFRLEKTSRKKLTAVAFGGRQVTKTKAQQNYIPRRVAGGQTNVLWWGTGKDRGSIPRVLLDLPKLNSFKYKRGGIKWYSQPDGRETQQA